MKQVLLALLTVPTLLSAQNSNEICKTITKISAVVQRNHFQPKPVDDSLSVFVFDNLMDELDNGRNLFSKQEYTALAENRLLLDDFINSGNCEFLEELMSTYKNALNRKRAVFLKLQNAVFNYNSHDSIRFSRKKFDFDVEDHEFEKVWNKRIRYDILEEIAKMSTNSDSLNANFSTIEKEVKDKIIESHLCRINSILDKDGEVINKIKNDFLNSFCTYFDPHSNYFSSDAKSSFMSGLSTTNLSLGIEISLNDAEEIVIEEIVPGGPASRNPKIHVGDIIIKVGNTTGLEYWVSCSSLEIIGDLIFSDTNKVIDLTLRKKNGSSIAVSLRKKVMKSTTNNVYSFIIEKNIKAGYIKIPNFYSDFEYNSIKGCADDVAKEIVKLKKDGVEGLIIDLQNNGGGSMHEAIKLVGMFINVGPISVLVDHKQRQNTLKDFSRGVVYDGPIIILINGYSASASEFFAAALQDHNRALIMGSTSLGKASMQAILALEENNDKDFIKLTIEKFYRISGDSHQLKGIIPDIFTPTLFDSIIKREDSFASALPYNTIETNNRFTVSSDFFNEELKNLSKSRIKNDVRFKEINRVNDQINSLYNTIKNPVRISFSDVFTSIHETDDLWEIVNQMNIEETDCIIKNNSYDLAKFGFDENTMTINSFKIKNVKSNPYVSEALNIISDYNQSKP
jgi:carboxyl-terminal processing protease